MLPTQFLIRTGAPLLGVALTALGVWLLREEWPLIGLLALAGGLAWAVISARSALRPLERAPGVDRPAGPLTWAVVVALDLIAIVLSAPGQTVLAYRIAAASWASAVVLGLAYVWARPARRSLGEGTRFASEHRWEAAGVLAIVVVAFALRVYDLSAHPYPWSGDEASTCRDALRILRGEVTNFFETGFASQSNWSFVPSAVAMRLVGPEIVASRLTSVIAGTLAVFFTYLLGRALFGVRVAAVAAVFLATLPFHLHFSRLGLHCVMDSVMVAAVFWWLARALKRQDDPSYYTGGILAGLCLYMYAGTRLVPLLALAGLAVASVRRRDALRTHARSIAVFVAGVMVSAAPQAWFYAHHRDIFMGRLAQEGIVLNGWLAAEAARRGNVFLPLVSQLRATVLPFFVTPVTGVFYATPGPFLGLAAATLALVGAAWACASPTRLRYAFVILWFWAVVIIGGVLTTSPPASSRLVMTTPAIALLVGIGVTGLGDAMMRVWRLPRRVVLVVTAIVVLGIAAQQVRFYMGEFRTRMYFADPNTEFAMEVGLMARGLSAGTPLYIMGAPRVFIGFPTLPFLASDRPLFDLASDRVASLEIDERVGASFFAIPDNRPALTEIAQRHPGGRSGRMYRKPRPDDVLFDYYILEPSR